VSLGNLRRDARVALLFMDYPNRVRLKVLGRVQLLDLDCERLAQVAAPDCRARVERGFVIQLEAFDWNCPQHITPRYTQPEVDAMLEAGVDAPCNCKTSRARRAIISRSTSSKASPSGKTP
jgi:uncharacterized protein